MQLIIVGLIHELPLQTMCFILCLNYYERITHNHNHRHGYRA